MEPPDFLKVKHGEYITKFCNDKESFEYIVTEHLRMSGVYWALTSLYLLGYKLDEKMNTEEIVEWLLSCQDENGGFGGSVGHDPHILYTLSALQILALTNCLHKVNFDKISSYIASLQQMDGSFFGDKWGEVDTRFSYCAVSALSIMGKLNDGTINLSNAMDYVGSCKNFDGGFGAVPGAESHAGQIFCCVGALSIGNSLELVDADLLGWWLAERQCDSGGLNGRPEKQADVCYSWWILSTLSMIGRVSWIDKEKLAAFILRCQDIEDGGISDRPGNMVDIFHTFFGISGLSLLGYFDKVEFADLSLVDATYALPSVLVKSLGLKAQTLG